MPNGIGKDLLQNLRLAVLDSANVSRGGRRTASVHEFYRYPARFSPAFARAAIATFTKPRDLVIDPFSGGGTSVVEAQLLGRHSIAADINPLATFVTTAKTTLYSEETLDELRGLSETVRGLPIRAGLPLHNRWAEQGYWRNISSHQTWRIRNLLLNGIDAVKGLATHEAQMLGRCALLRTGQWALDIRQAIPTGSQFRNQLSQDIKGMIEAASNHHNLVMEEWGEPTQPVVITSGLPASAKDPLMNSSGFPHLIITSPPYPGVYVLYHRWKVQGRRETPAPFWIANCLDGHGINHYTMSARNQDSSRLYFEKLRIAFSSIVNLMSTDTWMIQMVGFNNGVRQTNQYLHLMKDIGLEEIRFPTLANCSDGRLWRSVPGRRWWVVAGKRAGTAPNTSKEVVLFYRRR